MLAHDIQAVISRQRNARNGKPSFECYLLLVQVTDTLSIKKKYVQKVAHSVARLIYLKWLQRGAELDFRAHCRFDYSHLTHH